MKKIGLLILLAIVGFNYKLYAQLNTGTGPTWGELSPAEPLLIDENFQEFPFFHSDENPDQGNSENVFANDGTTIIYGYKQDTVQVPIIGSDVGNITYYFYQCAFAPEWKTAYAFQQETDNTPNVSDGFVEISRDYPYGEPPYTVHGWFTVDLREIDFVEVIQWSHSSTGGNKRGVMCEFSLDDGATWDTLRYQPGGAAYLGSFTKMVAVDPADRVKTYNGYRCDPSAFGMTWEDGIWAENVMLRFSECGGQTPRIHDLKVYGTYSGSTAAKVITKDELTIYSFNRKIHISEPSNVNIYNVTGNLVKSASRVSNVSMDEMPAGIYIVKAESDLHRATAKVLIK